jgi:hypothetical protein
MGLDHASARRVYMPFLAFSTLPHRFRNVSREAWRALPNVHLPFSAQLHRRGLSLEIVRGLSPGSRSRMAQCYRSRPVGAATRHGHSPAPLSKNLPDATRSLPHPPSGPGYVANRSAEEFLGWVNPSCNNLSLTNLLTSPHTSPRKPQKSLLRYTHSKSSTHSVTPKA